MFVRIVARVGSNVERYRTLDEQPFMSQPDVRRRHYSSSDLESKVVVDEKVGALDVAVDVFVVVNVC